MDRVRQIITRLSGGGTPAIDKALEAHHAEIMANAQRYASDAKRYSQLAIKAQSGDLKINPDTGKPPTPEDIEKWNKNAAGAWADYSKIAGKAKAAKPIIEKMGGLIQHITGHPAAAGGAGGAGGGAAAGGAPAAGGSPQGGQPAAPATAPQEASSPRGAPPPQPAQQGQQTVAPPPQMAKMPQQTVPPPPGGENPFESAARGEIESASMKEQDARRVRDDDYRDKKKADIDPMLQPPHVNQLKQEIADIMEAEPGITRDDAIRKAEQKLQITPKPGAAKLKTGWGKDAKGFYSYQIGPDNHPVPGSEDRTALPPASYLEHTREGFHYITDDDGNVHEIPNESKSGVALPGDKGGGSGGGKPSSGGGGRVVGHSATAPQKKVEEAADALETEARKVDKYVAEPSPTNDTALLFSYVRAQVAGAGRMTNTEIKLAIESNSMGTRIKNYYDRATKGELDPEFRAQAARSVKVAAAAAREEADKYRKPRGGTVKPPPTSSKSIDDEIMEAVHGQSGKH
jgi:hypothetical protein